MTIEIIRISTDCLGFQTTCMTAFNSPTSLREKCLSLDGASYGFAGMAIITNKGGVHLFKFYYSFNGDDGDIKHIHGAYLPQPLLEQYRRTLKSMIPAYGWEYLEGIANS